jgi:acetyltransferase-like isoleucine patch superfamily enzyme
MAIYRTVDVSALERKACTDRVVQTLTGMGAILSPDFECLGLPHISYGDITPGAGKELDLAPFKGRLVLGGKMNSSDIAHFPAGPVRITIVRWGTEPEQCGKIIVGKTDLNSTSLVSYVGITIGDYVHLDPRVVIMDSGGHPTDRRLEDCTENRKVAPVVIEDHAWIGYGATITPGVTIGHHAVVAPGAVVMWNVRPGATVMGNPAKYQKVYQKYFDADQAETKE